MTEEITTDSQVQEPVVQQPTESQEVPPAPITRDNLEAIKLKAELSKTQKQYEELVNQMKAKQTEEMKQKEDWQKLATHWETEAKDYEKRYMNMQQSVVFDKKLTDLKTKAAAENIRKEALDDLEMLDLNEIHVETTSTGKLNVLGTEDLLSKLKVKKPHWFQSAKTNFNTQTPTATSSGDTTYKDVRDAELKWKKSQNKADLSAYQSKLLKFKNKS